MNYIEARNQLHHKIYTALGMEELMDSSISNEDVNQIVEILLPQWRKNKEVVNNIGTQVDAFLPFYYVIPEKDLKLVESITSLLSAMGGANYFMTHFHVDPEKGIASAITGIIVTILQLSNKLKLASHLEPFEYAILVILSGNKKQGHNEGELFNLLSINFNNVTVEYIRQCLNKMSAYPTISGTKSDLVWLDSEDRWHTNV